MAVPLPEALLGLLLLYVLPGLTITQALFPDWRFRGPQGVERLVTTAALSVILSTSLTIVVGFALTGLPGGFSASWSSPLLEGVLGAVTVAGALVAWRRGAYSRVPPPAPMAEPGPAEGDAWATIRSLEQLHREERRLRHLLRTDVATAESAGARSRLEEVRAEIARLGAERGRELAK